MPQVDCLDEDQLRRNIREWEREISYEESEEEPNYSFIRRLRSYIRDAQAKLDAMSNFVRVTGGIYDRAGDINRILKKADTELNKVQYDPKSMTLDFSSVNRHWILEMEALKVLEQLKADGLTDEQIQEAQNYGFTVEQITAAWEEMKEKDIGRAEVKRMEGLGVSFGQMLDNWSYLVTDSDKQLYVCLSKGDYIAAFQVDPKEVSNQTSYILVNFTNQLAVNGNIPELQRLINGMLYTDEEHSPYPNSYGQDAYGLEYLNRLFAASSAVLEKQCTALWQAAGILTEEEKDALGKEIKLQAHTNALWKTLSNVSYGKDYFMRVALKAIRVSFYMEAEFMI